MSKNYTFCTVQATSAEFIAPEEEGKKPYVSVTVKVTDGPRAGEEITQSMSLSGGAVKYTMEALRNLGWSCNDVTELTGVGDCSARGGIYKETYKDKTYTKCGIWPLRKKAAAVSGKAKKDFAAMFKKAAATVDKVDIDDSNRAIDRAALPDSPPPPSDDFAEEDPFDCGF